MDLKIQTYAFIIQVASFCPLSFLIIIIPSITPIVLYLILWIDKREAFSGFCLKFSGLFLALSFYCQRREDQKMLFAEVFTACNLPSHNKGFHYLHLRWKKKFPSKRPASDRCVWIFLPHTQENSHHQHPVNLKVVKSKNHLLGRGAALAFLFSSLASPISSIFPNRVVTWAPFTSTETSHNSPWKHEPLFTLERMTGSSCAQQ